MRPAHEQELVNALFSKFSNAEGHSGSDLMEGGALARSASAASCLKPKHLRGNDSHRTVPESRVASSSSTKTLALNVNVPPTKMASKCSILPSLHQNKDRGGRITSSFRNQTRGPPPSPVLSQLPFADNLDCLQIVDQLKEGGNGEGDEELKKKTDERTRVSAHFVAKLPQCSELLGNMRCSAERSALECDTESESPAGSPCAAVGNISHRKHNLAGSASSNAPVTIPSSCSSTEPPSSVVSPAAKHGSNSSRSKVPQLVSLGSSMSLLSQASSALTQLSADKSEHALCGSREDSSSNVLGEDAGVFAGQSDDGQPGTEFSTVAVAVAVAMRPQMVEQLINTAQPSSSKLDLKPNRVSVLSKVSNTLSATAISSSSSDTYSSKIRNDQAGRDYVLKTPRSARQAVFGAPMPQPKATLRNIVALLTSIENRSVVSANAIANSQWSVQVRGESSTSSPSRFGLHRSSTVSFLDRSSQMQDIGGMMAPVEETLTVLSKPTLQVASVPTCIPSGQVRLTADFSCPFLSTIPAHCISSSQIQSSSKNSSNSNSNNNISGASRGGAKTEIIVLSLENSFSFPMRLCVYCLVSPSVVQNLSFCVLPQTTSTLTLCALAVLRVEAVHGWYRAAFQAVASSTNYRSVHVAFDFVSPERAAELRRCRKRQVSSDGRVPQILQVVDMTVQLVSHVRVGNEWRCIKTRNEFIRHDGGLECDWKISIPPSISSAVPLSCLPTDTSLCVRTSFADS
eukprot:ANDGO_07726.mRNA.1 hypothetical protein